ncbi:MAG: ABC transporter ATP-binding protein [Tidjanibacter sp.]|nr:ABC transporter ATP-binding protein [Tidjanibacter sp.]
MTDAKRINTVSLNDLTLGYGQRRLFCNANVGFGWGEFTALVGRNGSGKSTLLRTIAALSKPVGGTISVCGRELSTLSQREVAERIAFVSTDEVKVPDLRVVDLVSIGRAPYTNWAGSLTDNDRAVVAKSLELVGMTSFGEASVDSLSDGERQRVMIARALAQDTPVVLLDEPTAFLDLPNKYEICLLLSRLAHIEGKCVIFSTHDLQIALELCDTIAMIDDGEFRYGTADMLVQSGALQHMFDRTQLEFNAVERTVRLKK